MRSGANTRLQRGEWRHRWRGYTDDLRNGVGTLVGNPHITGTVDRDERGVVKVATLIPRGVSDDAATIAKLGKGRGGHGAGDPDVAPAIDGDP